ncbi:ABC transporter ATP-binding protein [Uliginosibacterium sp. sgz301328]|uniref:ABC transporter ATP-binding protein n=1 Tax=Uliginosibacterium sp. sgz301328 TaxID=3243764 RepID=UPI00359E2F80
MCSEVLAIEARHIGKRFIANRGPWRSFWHALRGTHGASDGGYQALRDVTFSVARGETVGFIGRNGAGKSTLLQILCGTLRPSSGTIHVNGKVAALLELGAGFNPDFTGRENVFLNASLLGLPRRQIAARLPDIQAFAEIGEFFDQPVRTYSSGMFVRLAFAVMAHVDADILVIDEALAVGDAHFTQKCMRFLHSFRQRGTLLFVSHDTQAVTGLCDRAIWLEDGVVREEGSAKSVCESYLATLFGTEQRAAASPSAAPAKARILHDQRQPWLNRSPLRNDIELFAFQAEATRFGHGSASIDKVVLLDEDGRELSWMVGGEPVSVEIHATCHATLQAPIVGFYVKDRLGQTLFGDNTFLTCRPGPARHGQRLVARFSFHLPYLPAGDYSLAAAIGDGTQDDHVQHDWVHDALFFRSHSTSVSTGLVGLPMQRISLETASPE